MSSDARSEILRVDLQMVVELSEHDRAKHKLKRR